MKINNKDRIALISDIHSNYISFEEIYKILRKKDITKIIFLGDYLSDCPYPMKTVEILEKIKTEYPCHFIRGNREDYLLDYHDNHPDWSSPTGRGSLRYTYENTDKDFIESFREMPLSISTDKFIFCHGSPASNTELLHIKFENVDRWLKKTQKNIVCGHTHVKANYKKYGKYIINPGSAGLSMEKAKAGSFAILKINKDYFETEFINYDYDYKKLYKDFKESGLFDISGIWGKAIYKNILTGKPITSYIVKEAFAYARAEGINSNIIPEYYWEKAAEKYGLGDLND